MKQLSVAAVVLIFILLGCGPSSNPAPPLLAAFPTHPEPTSGHDQALLQGKLIVSGGCLRLRLDYLPEDTFLIYWPYGYSYRENAKGIKVFDEAGRFVATVGDYLSLVGGEYYGDITGGRCKGLTWNAGSVNPAPGLAP